MINSIFLIENKTFLNVPFRLTADSYDLALRVTGSLEGALCARDDRRGTLVFPFRGYLEGKEKTVTKAI